MSLTDLMHKPIQKMNKKPQYKLIDIDDIEVNKNNFFDVRDIEQLSLNIKTNGLYKPLEVYKSQENEHYVLIGGERRYRALLLLVEQEIIEPEIPCLIYKEPSNLQNEKLQIITSNAQRILSEDEKQKIVDEIKEIVELDPSIKPKGMAMREYIATFLGCSPRTIQKYMNEKNVSEEADDNSEKETEDNKQDEKQKQFFKDLNKMLKEESVVPVNVKEKSLTIKFECFDQVIDTLLELEYINNDKHKEILADWR